MQVAILNTNATLVMTSREIAELVNQRHDNVKRTIDTLAARGVIVRPQIEDEQSPDTMGRPRTMQVCRLDKRSSLIVVAQLCPEFTARLVDRWQELEAQNSKPANHLPDFTNPATAARAWADAVELAQAKTVQLAIAAPKVAALDRISSADGSMCITNAAKTLKMQPKRLFAWLSECKWIYRRAGGKSWVAYQDRIQAGLLGHDVTVLEKGGGSEKAVTSIFVTAKGLAKLAAEVVA